MDRHTIVPRDNLHPAFGCRPARRALSHTAPTYTRAKPRERPAQPHQDPRGQAALTRVLRPGTATTLCVPRHGQALPLPPCLDLSAAALPASRSGIVASMQALRPVARHHRPRTTRPAAGPVDKHEQIEPGSGRRVLARPRTLVDRTWA
jgi:hypothetical protein